MGKLVVMARTLPPTKISNQEKRSREHLFPTEVAAATARGIIERAGIQAGLSLSVHPHMLRHACGFYLASRGHDTRAIQAYLGHRNIQHTVRYTELSPKRFQEFWMD